VHSTVHPKTLLLIWYIEIKVLDGFRQAYINDALWDRDECFTFWGQKVKGQGHATVKYARSSTLRACYQDMLKSIWRIFTKLHQWCIMAVNFGSRGQRSRSRWNKICWKQHFTRGGIQYLTLSCRVSISSLVLHSSAVQSETESMCWLVTCVHCMLDTVAYCNFI